MKPIEARNQVNLSLGRVVQLAVTGMSYRMFRSAITVAILALAVAFLVHMLAYGLLSNQAQLAAYEELAEQRALGEQITRLTTPDTKTQVMRALAEGTDERLAEYRRWAGVEAPEFDAARQTAVTLKQVADYTVSLPIAAHAVLVGDFTSEELFDHLGRPDRLGAFIQKVQQMNLPPPLGDVERFRRLILAERPKLVVVAEKIVTGHERAIEQVARTFPNRRPAELAANPPSSFATALSDAGFSFSEGEVGDLRQFARRAEDLKTMNQLILVPDTRAKLARESDIALGEVNLDSLMRLVDGDAGDAKWLAGVLREAKAPGHLVGPRIATLSESYVRERQLQRAVGDEVPERQDGLLGMSERSRWLIILSFLVCVVGVANAMLMSVTERFTEIATMKCLGAMDRFVMVMFVFEATIQGLLGGLAGLLLGVLLAVMRGFAEFGGLFSGAGGAVSEVVIGMSVSLVVGMVLAAVAAVGPAFIAARLAPMEAMRVD